MKTQPKLSFMTLLMMISFASVNAVLFTPALPNIANFFAISVANTQQTMTWFLIGYALGQLIYGPLANRYGRKKALYLGISLQIMSSVLCILSGSIHEYLLLVIGRFLLACGSGVGLKMAFTLINESYEPKIASQKTSYLMLAFAITPALGVALGGMLNTEFGWMSCFYATALYGVALLFLVTRIPETQLTLDYQALNFKNLLNGYSDQFKNKQLIAGAILIGFSSAIIYVFAALAPFVTMNLLGMNSVEYGEANILPTLGIIFGSLFAAELTKRMPLEKIIILGSCILLVGVLLITFGLLQGYSAIFAIFLPMMIVYFGLSLIFANAATIALKNTNDKAYGSAVMNFINMGTATLAVLSLGFFATNIILLPTVYLVLALGMGYISLQLIKGRSLNKDEVRIRD